MPHGFPVYSRRLHRHVRYRLQGEPVLQIQQRRGGRRKALHLIVLGLGNAANARHHVILMHIEPRTTLVQYLHKSSTMTNTKWRREKPSSSNSSIRARRALARPWQQFGVLAGSRVQLANGLVAPSTNRPHS